MKVEMHLIVLYCILFYYDVRTASPVPSEELLSTNAQAGDAYCVLAETDGKRQARSVDQTFQFYNGIQTIYCSFKYIYKAL